MNFSKVPNILCTTDSHFEDSSIKLHHQTRLRAIWRRSKERRTGVERRRNRAWKKPVAARALGEMDLRWRSIESNLRLMNIVQLGTGENGDLDGQPGATADTLHFLGLIVSNHLEDLLFCLTVWYPFLQLNLPLQDRSFPSHFPTRIDLLKRNMTHRCWWTVAFCWIWCWGQSSGTPSTLSLVASWCSTFSRQKPFITTLLQG